MKTQIIVVANQKGGVGKTTNTIHVARALAELGKKCLIIDLDSSAGATTTMGVPTTGWDTIYEVIAGEVSVDEAIIKDDDQEVRLPKNIHLIPASLKLNELDSFLNRDENLGIVPQDLLVRPIADLRGKYDYVFLDSPPLVTKTTFPAYKVADYAILSTQLEKLSFERLENAMKLIASAHRNGNSQLTLLGILVTMVPQPTTRLAMHYLDLIDKNYLSEDGEPYRISAVIHRNVAIQEAATAKQTLFEYQPDHRVLNGYRAVAKEIEERIKKREGFKNLQVQQVVNG
jgi:chromosome partitioning protein